MGCDYTVTIGTGNTKQVAFVGFMLSLFSAISFLFETIHSTTNPYFFLVAAIIQCVGIGGQLNALRKGKKPRFRSWIWAAAICWIAMPVLSWLFFPLILLGLLEFPAGEPVQYLFGQAITRRSLISKSYGWNDFQRIMIKDGLLSLDFRNNRLLQLDIADPASVNEPEFNRFCREKIVNLRQ